jgi:hypothetical protein
MKVEEDWSEREKVEGIGRIGWVEKWEIEGNVGENEEGGRDEWE